MFQKQADTAVYSRGGTLEAKRHVLSLCSPRASSVPVARPTLVSFRRTHRQALQHRRTSVGCDTGTVEEMVLVLRFLVFFFFFFFVVVVQELSFSCSRPSGSGILRQPDGSAVPPRCLAGAALLPAAPGRCGWAGGGGRTAGSGGPAVRGVPPAVPLLPVSRPKPLASRRRSAFAGSQPGTGGHGRPWARWGCRLPPLRVGRAGGRFPAPGARPSAPGVGGEERWRAGGGGHGGGGASSPSESGVWAR